MDLTALQIHIILSDIEKLRAFCESTKDSTNEVEKILNAVSTIGYSIANGEYEKAYFDDCFALLKLLVPDAGFNFFENIDVDVTGDSAEEKRDNAQKLALERGRAAYEAPYEILKSRIQSFLTEQRAISKEREQIAELAVLLFGISLLHIYIQCNYTGPPIKLLPITPFNLEFKINTFSDYKSIDIYGDSHNPMDQARRQSERALWQVNQFAMGFLDMDGEYAYEKVKIPHYLACAKLFLCRSDIVTLDSYYWWKARATIIHQHLLPHPSQTLLEDATKCFDTVVDKYSPMTDYDYGSLVGRVYLEYGLMHHYFMEADKSKQKFEKAKEATGLVEGLTGALGKRTKHQTFTTSQLVLQARSRTSDSEKQDSSTEASSSSDSGEGWKKEVELDKDSDLLPTVQTDKEAEEKEANLRVIDQAIILALCLDVKNNNPAHGLTTEEMFPYVTRVQMHPNNWLVYSMCLLIKTRLESEKSRTVERSVLQLQVLVDQFADAEPGARTRMEYFFGLSFPPLFALKKELGTRFLSIGVARSALQVFEELEMWDEIINCYIVMEKHKKAQELIVERLALNDRDAKLWCLLGDLQKNPEHYITAWEKSGHRYARAQRSLGFHYIRNNEHEKAIDALEKALALSSLYPMSWFALGCQHMQKENWSRALVSFTRVVQQEPEEAEAWSNMGAVLIRMDKKREAFTALLHALKFRRENWKIWENFLYVCMDIGEYAQAMQAMKTLLELTDKRVDIDVIAFLSKVVRDMYANDDKRQADFLRDRLGDLLTHITAKVSNNAKIWEVCAHFQETLGDNDKVLENRLKQIRALQIAGFDKEEAKFKPLAVALTALAKFCVKLADNAPTPIESEAKQTLVRRLASTVMAIKPVLTRTTELFSALEEHKQLGASLEEVSAALEKCKAL